MNPKALRDPILFQAAIAAAISFTHIHDLAEAAGQEGWKAWAYPISVDLLMVMAWRSIRSNDASRGAWCWFLLSLGASLGANVATSGLVDLDNVPVWLSVLVGGWPVVAFLGGSFMVHAHQEDQEPEEEEDQGQEEDEPVVSLPISEAAKQARANVNTVRTWVQRGEIKSLGKVAGAHQVSLREVIERMNKEKESASA